MSIWLVVRLAPLTLLKCELLITVQFGSLVARVLLVTVCAVGLRAHAAEHDGIRTQPAIDLVVVGIGDERVVPAATDRSLDDGVQGNADIVRLEVRAAERSRIEIDRRGRGPSGQVKRVVGTSIPNRND